MPGTPANPSTDPNESPPPPCPGGDRTLCVNIDLDDLRATHEGWMPAFMNAPV